MFNLLNFWNMKNISLRSFWEVEFNRRYFNVGIFLAATLFCSLSLKAQEAGEEESQEDVIELIAPAMDVKTIQRSDGSVVLITSMRARIEGSMRLLWGMKVSYFQETSDGEIAIGEAISNQKGVSRIEISPDKIKEDQNGKLSFIARYAGNKTLEETEEAVTITRAMIRVEPLKTDEGYSLNLSLLEGNGDKAKPLPEMDLNIYIQRMFSLLKIGEAATDEDGAAVMEIPNSFTGDADGNITLMARLEENEDYGLLEASVVQPWGIPVSDHIAKMPRSLFSQDPPVWMLITFIVLMLTVWGHYVVIIYELVKLRKDIE